MEKNDQLMKKSDVQKFTQYVVNETKNAIMQTTGSSIGGMSHSEAEMWAKTCIAAKLYPQKDKGLTPTELVSRALVKGVAGSKYGLDFFESQRLFHILHDGTMAPDYKLRIWQMNAAPNFRFEYTDDGETCTGTVSEKIDGKWVAKNPISFSTQDAVDGGLVNRDEKSGKLSGSRDPWVKWTSLMRLSKVAHRCFNFLCGELKLSADKLLLSETYDGDDDSADPFAVDTLELTAAPDDETPEPVDGELFSEPEPETDPLADFLELANVKFADEKGELDSQAYEKFLNNRRPEHMNAEGIARLTEELRSV